MSNAVGRGSLTDPITLKTRDYFFWHPGSSEHPLFREIELTAEQEQWLTWAMFEHEKVQKLLRDAYYRTFYLTPDEKERLNKQLDDIEGDSTKKRHLVKTKCPALD
jgi:hypothetical protein